VIRKSLIKFFEAHGITSDAEVNVLIAGEKKAQEIASKNLKRGEPAHNVLSFPASETKDNGTFIYPPDTLYLGDIVVCYPILYEEAKKEGKSIEQKVIELVEHAGLHLMGIHHE